MLRLNLRFRPLTAAAAACVVLVAGAAHAQTTFTVNPGGSIQAAVDAAVAGDRIVVKTGSYAGFTVSKGVWIVGQAGAQITAFGGSLETLTITGVPAGEQCTVAGLTLGGSTIAPLAVTNCAGLVILENISDGVNNGGIRQITNCAQVFLNSCLMPRITITDSKATLLNCGIQGLSTVFGSPGLDLFNSTVYVSRCTIAGADAVLPAPAIRSNNSTLRLTDDGTTMITAGAGGSGRSAIEGSCNLYLDDDVTLLPTGTKTPTGFGVNVIPGNIPSLRVLGAPLGGTVTIDIYSEAGELYFVLAGIPGGVFPIPVFKGEFWLNPIILIVVLSGTFDGSARATAQYTVPNDPVFLGITTGFQAFTGSMTELTLSNPATATYSM